MFKRKTKEKPDEIFRRAIVDAPLMPPSALMSVCRL